MTPHSADLPQRAKRLALEGRIIEAIKLTREQTGAGLVEAKDLIRHYLHSRGNGAEERIDRDAPSPSPSPRPIPARAILLLDEGNTIEAIKVTRERLGVDLRSAKQAVDLYLAQNPQIQRKHSGTWLSRLWDWVTTPQGFFFVIFGAAAFTLVALQGKR